MKGEESIHECEMSSYRRLVCLLRISVSEATYKEDVRSGNIGQITRRRRDFRSRLWKKRTKRNEPIVVRVSTRHSRRLQTTQRSTGRWVDPGTKGGVTVGSKSRSR